ncbi:MAG TPA: PIN domain-containing protein [Verrucomicrobiales bacterium]|nr:PIN domain-containing protein [Verrucomicrobiales bacterium]
MNVFDSTILVAALVESEYHHSACRALVTAEPFGVWTHDFVETFNTLTSSKIKPRPSASNVAKVLRHSIAARAAILRLPEEQMLTAFDEAESRGVRGGAIFDYLHLATARHHKAERIYTLNSSHFESFRRGGDPTIAHP